MAPFSWDISYFTSVKYEISISFFPYSYGKWRRKDTWKSKGYFGILISYKPIHLGVRTCHSLLQKMHPHPHRKAVDMLTMWDEFLQFTQQPFSFIFVRLPASLERSILVYTSFTECCNIFCFPFIRKELSNSRAVSTACKLLKQLQKKDKSIL